MRLLFKLLGPKLLALANYPLFPILYLYRATQDWSSVLFLLKCLFIPCGLFLLLCLFFLNILALIRGLIRRPLSVKSYLPAFVMVGAISLGLLLPLPPTKT